MVDDYMPEKVLHKIKEVIGIKKFGNIKTLKDTDDKLLNDITLKKVVILLTRVIKDDKSFYLQLFLGKKTVC